MSATTSKSTRSREIPQEGKAIIYDAETEDYGCYLDGEYIGHRPNFSAAETALNTLMMDRLHQGDYRTATEMDGGNSIEEIAADYAETLPAPKFYGVSVSPGVSLAGGSLADTPMLAIRDGVPTIRLGGDTDEELAEIMANDPEPPISLLPQRIYEVARLNRRGLVVLDAEHEVFLMTEAEYVEQVGSACEARSDVSIAHKGADWIECRAGGVTIGFEKEWIALFGAREQHTWGDGCAFFAALDRLLIHPYLRLRLGLDPRPGPTHEQARMDGAQAALCAMRVGLAADTTPRRTLDLTSFHCRVGSAAGTLTAILTDMPREAGERALTLLNDLIELLDDDTLAPDDVPALAV